MRIGLIDVDSHNFPNLVLMKFSAWYKQQGHETCLLSPEDVFNGGSLFRPVNKLIGACVFDWNKPIADRLKRIGAWVAGTGTKDYKTILPYEIEHVFPDYSLYDITDTAYGFLTRGCPRHCPFCIVGDKEGLISWQVADLAEFWNGQKNIQLMDPNLLACSEHTSLLRQLADSKARVDFNQGLDARLLTKENMELLDAVKIKRIHFAWDNPRDNTTKAKLEMFAKRKNYKPNSRHAIVYVLTNFWSTHQEDLYRIYWLRDIGYQPYVMIFDKEHAPRETRLLQRWCNNFRIFNACRDFEDYDPSMG